MSAFSLLCSAASLLPFTPKGQRNTKWQAGVKTPQPIFKTEEAENPEKSKHWTQFIYQTFMMMRKLYLLLLLCSLSLMTAKAQVTNIAVNLQFPYDAALYGNDLYITELGAGRLVKVDVTAPFPAPIEEVLSGLNNPAAMTIGGDFLYYGESGADRISRIDLTQANPVPEIIVSTGLQTPNDLFVDGNFLYITDEGNDRFMRVDLTVENPTPETIASGLSNPLGITKYGGDFYLSIFGSATIVKVDVSQTPAVVTTIATGFTSPAGITVDGSFLYIAENNRVSRLNLNDASPTIEVVVSEDINGSRNVAFNGIDMYLAQTGGTFGSTGVVSRVTLNTPAFSSLPSVCANDMPTMLGGATPSTGVYSGPGVTDNGDGQTFSFDPTAAGGVGTYNVTYTLGGAMVSTTLEVVAAPTVTFSTGDLSVQEDAGVQTGLSGGMPTGGVYSGNGVTDDGNGMTYSFDPAVAGVGENVITYTYSDANGCGGEQGAIITVTPAIPPGDNCSIAIDINSLFGQTPGEPQVSAEAYNHAEDYNDDPTDPNAAPLCGFDWGTNVIESTWFSFTGDGSTYTINSIGADPFGDLFTGECGSLTEIACNDDTDGLNFSLEIATEAGVEYFLYTGRASGSGSFNLEVTRAEPPVLLGEQCDIAIDINSLFGQAEMVSQLSDENNHEGYSYNDTDPTTNSCGWPLANFPTIWYGFTGDGNRYSITSTGTDVAATIYSGECGNLTEVACNDDAVGTNFGFEIQTEVGVDYLISVVHALNETGAFNIEVTNLGTVGVTNIQETAIRLYPNPTSGFFQLDGIDAVRVMVFDQLGRQVARFDQPTQQMDIQALPAGVYTLRIEDTDGQFYSARVVKE